MHGTWASLPFPLAIELSGAKELFIFIKKNDRYVDGGIMSENQTLPLNQGFTMNEWLAKLSDIK